MRQTQGKRLHRVLGYYTYLLLAWGFFRLLFKFPDNIEELWFKPVIWLVPLLWLWMTDKGKQRVEFFAGKWLDALKWGLGLGLAYGVVAAITSLQKYGSVNLESLLVYDTGTLEFLGLGLVTAISEELVFSGYIFQKLKLDLGNSWVAMVSTAVLFALIHIPISIFVYQYGFLEMLGFLLVVGMVSFGNAFLMDRTKNVLAPILSHWLWGVVVFLFR